MLFALEFTDTFDTTVIATAVAAAGPVGTLIAALVQLSRERTRRRTAEKREQAEKISAWLAEQFADEEGGRQRIDLRNGSEGPVYQVILYLVFIQGA